MLQCALQFTAQQLRYLQRRQLLQRGEQGQRHPEVRPPLSAQVLYRLQQSQVFNSSIYYVTRLFRVENKVRHQEEDHKCNKV